MQTYEINLWLDKKIIEKIVKQFEKDEDVLQYWMVVNNDHKVVIMRSWCVDRDDNHGGGAIAIPKGWVTKIEYLQGAHADVRN